MGSWQIQSVSSEGMCRRGAQRQLGGHRRPGERETRAPRARPIPGRAPREVPEIRHDAVTRRPLLRTARLRQDPAGQGKSP